MNKKAITICLKCGQVQIRTDIEEQINGRYIVLNKVNCPKCKKKTKAVVTSDIKALKKELETNKENNLDSYILKLLKR